MSADRLQSQATGTTKPARRLAFSTPMGVSAVAVVAVAIIAGLLLFGPRGLIGFGVAASPTPSPEPMTPSPTASIVATPTPDVTSSPTPTSTPRPLPSPIRTTEPTPTPVAAWTGLEWSDGAVVNGTVGTPPYRGVEDAFWVVSDAIFWRGSWVGVGWGGGTADYPADFGPAFFRSDDGRTWSVSDRGGPGSLGPEQVVPTSNGLLAVSVFDPQPALLWASSDGFTWRPVNSPTWQAMAPSSTTRGESIVGGVAGVIVIGAREEDEPTHHVQPVVLHSTDGFTWTTAALDAEFDHASFSSAAAFEDGFVVTGSDDVTWGDTLHWTSRPAAWHSPDGLEWFRADVEAEVVPRGELTNVHVGAAGMTAEGLGAPAVGEGLPARWASVDGLTWRATGPRDEEQIGRAIVGSDGTRIVAVTTDPDTLALGIWVSTDGVGWTPLVTTGATASVQEWFDPYMSGLWVGPDGVILKSGGGYATPTQYWFAAAVE